MANIKLAKVNVLPGVSALNKLQADASTPPVVTAMAGVAATTDVSYYIDSVATDSTAVKGTTYTYDGTNFVLDTTQKTVIIADTVYLLKGASVSLYVSDMTGATITPLSTSDASIQASKFKGVVTALPTTSLTSGDVYYITPAADIAAVTTGAVRNPDLTASNGSKWIRYVAMTGHSDWVVIADSEYVASELTLKPIAALTKTVGTATVNIVSLQEAIEKLATVTTTVSTNTVEW